MSHHARGSGPQDSISFISNPNFWREHTSRSEDLDLCVGLNYTFLSQLPFSLPLLQWNWQPLGRSGQLCNLMGNQSIVVAWLSYDSECLFHTTIWSWIFNHLLCHAEAEPNNLSITSTMPVYREKNATEIWFLSLPHLCVSLFLKNGIIRSLHFFLCSHSNSVFFTAIALICACVYMYILQYNLLRLYITCMYGYFLEVKI